MRCTDPRTVGFQADGKTITWSQKNYSKEYATFQLPCGKCIECRLEYARQWAVRCVHEAKMYEKNSFITLTYSDEHLKSPQLDYSDFQKFMKKLRKLQNDPIGVFVTGEYGEKNKRPHWHAIIFNWRPTDGVRSHVNGNGDPLYESDTLNKLWGKGKTDFGEVTFQSAGYVARYAAKKLVHGSDQDHDYQPISKKSSKHAIGKKFLEKFWPDIFNDGYIILPDSYDKCAIPRYYEKWLKEHQPTEWNAYVTKTKENKIAKASQQSEKNRLLESEIRSARISRRNYSPQRTRNDARTKIIDSKFKQLQSKLKL